MNQQDVSGKRVPRRDKKELELVYRLRRVLSEMNPVEAVELLKSRLAKTRSNAEFLMTMNID